MSTKWRKPAVVDDKIVDEMGVERTNERTNGHSKIQFGQVHNKFITIDWKLAAAYE